MNLLMVLMFGIAGVMLVPAALGYHRYIILTGSMTGTYDPGSLVFDKPVPTSSLKVGDPITYAPPPGKSPNQKLVTHRIYKLVPGPDGQRAYITKGDANPRPDNWKFVLKQPTQDKVQFHLPYVGYVFMFLSVREFRTALIGIPALLMAGWMILGMWRDGGEQIRRRREGVKPWGANVAKHLPKLAPLAEAAAAAARASVRLRDPLAGDRGRRRPRPPQGGLQLAVRAPPSPQRAPGRRRAAARLHGGPAASNPQGARARALGLEARRQPAHLSAGAARVSCPRMQGDRDSTDAGGPPELSAPLMVIGAAIVGAVRRRDRRDAVRRPRRRGRLVAAGRAGCGDPARDLAAVACAASPRADLRLVAAFGLTLGVMNYCLLRGAGPDPAGHRGDDRVRRPARRRGRAVAPAPGPRLGRAGGRGHRAARRPRRRLAGPGRPGADRASPRRPGRPTSCWPRASGRGSPAGAGWRWRWAWRRWSRSARASRRRAATCCGRSSWRSARRSRCCRSVIPYSLETEALRRMPRDVFGVLMSLEPALAALAGLPDPRPAARRPRAGRPSAW